MKRRSNRSSVIIPRHEDIRGKMAIPVVYVDYKAMLGMYVTGSERNAIRRGVPGSLEPTSLWMAQAALGLNGARGSKDKDDWR